VIIVIVLLLIFMVFAVAAVAKACDTKSGKAGDWAIWIVSLGSISVCEQFAIDNIPDVPSPLARDRAPGVPTDLVTLVGVVPIEGASDPRVRACLKPFVQSLFTKARAAGLNIVLTSAYRPGAVTFQGKPSGHGKGEAFDVGLRPAASFSPNPPDRRIDRLIAIAFEVGFKPPEGDTVDEYNFPSSETLGPHVHMEFNAGYCDQYGTF
jgi:hypothetical protein